ncbi:MAG TPA: tripartite tricarboxylate transporter substrate binding protein [Alphaproteobacteria bacterium]
MTLVRLSALALGLALGAAAAQAQPATWPTRPVKLVNPFPAGGPVDIVARVVAQSLSERVGQQVIVDNRAGAAGAIGSEVVAHSPPDGYTILMGSSATHGINVSLYPSLPYDPLKDFVAVSLVARIVHVLVVNPAVPVTSVRELIEYARAKPGEIYFGSPGSGTNMHLVCEMLKARFGLDIVHVPYRGGPPAMQDLLSNRIQLMCDFIPQSLQHIRAGGLRPLAVTGPERSAQLPDVPTMAEAGVPDFVTTAWLGLFAPAGTPAAIVDRLYRTIAAIGQDPEYRRRIVDAGAEPVTMPPKEFAAFDATEIERWREVVKISGAKVD